MDDCMRTAKEVIDDVRARNVPNGPFLIAKAHYIISAVYRENGDFTKAREHMEYSNEVKVAYRDAFKMYNGVTCFKLHV
jgi:hypothetical protein